MCVVSKSKNNSEKTSSQTGLWSKQDLADFFGVAVWSIDNTLRKISDFPAPYWVTPTTPRWEPSEAKAWLTSRPRGGIAPAWRGDDRQRKRRRR
jgi:hypothetical protein